MPAAGADFRRRRARLRLVPTVTRGTVTASSRLRHPEVTAVGANLHVQLTEGDRIMHRTQLKSARRWKLLPVGALAAAGMAGAAHAAPIQTVFTIALENHNFTQPNPAGPPRQLLGNLAAPYLNSLVTPGNPNAANTSYFSQMTNVAPGIHPSEPNYIWQNGGSNFGVLSDADPSAAAGNIITAQSFTGQLTQKGISWNSYQEDVQYSTSSLVSASGTGGTAPSGVTVTTNPYNGTLQYNYAVKHNPQAFFTDSQNLNVKTFAQLTTDLANNTYAQYNWITPDQYNDMHSSLSGGFTYHGVLYTGDQAAIAEGDNFLSIIVPQIEATTAFQNGTGMIEIWDDESEIGDTSAYAIPEIIISKDAVGNAFDVTELVTHSGSLLTDQEIFQTGACLLASCGATDLSAAFLPGSIPSSVPEPASIAVLGVGLLGFAMVLRRNAA
jgi:phosphatidylinositol-3-phosphatase